MADVLFSLVSLTSTPLLVLTSGSAMNCEMCHSGLMQIKYWPATSTGTSSVEKGLDVSHFSVLSEQFHSLL